MDDQLQPLTAEQQPRPEATAHRQVTEMAADIDEPTKANEGLVNATADVIVAPPGDVSFNFNSAGGQHDLAQTQGVQPWR